MASGAVNASTGITVSVTPAHESCNICNNGSATANASGGTGYTYLWNNSATTQTITNLAPGIYTVTMTSSGGCTSSASVSIQAFGCGGFTLSFNSTNPQCFGDCNGAALVVPTGGKPPYSYIWSNGSISQATNGLCAGKYTVTVVDANACAGIGTVDIIGKQPLVVNLASQDSMKITATVQGGTPPYTYAWSTGAISESIEPSTSGIYKVTVTDANGCRREAEYHFIRVATEETAGIALRIYPNPTTGLISIQTDVMIKNIKVTDIQGRALSVPDLNESGIDLSVLNNGMYLLHINTDHGVFMHKLLIVK